jgi:hypothetical protein
MSEVKPTYVDFNTAKWLKEKGFNEECRQRFWEDNNEDIMCFQDNCSKSNWNDYDDSQTIYYSAPEQWQVVEWLRINYNIDVHHVIVGAFHYGYNVFQNRNRKHKEEGYYITPQEAYSAAFDYIKDNNLI